MSEAESNSERRSTGRRLVRRLLFRSGAVVLAGTIGLVCLEASFWASPARVPTFLGQQLSSEDRAAVAIHAAYAERTLDPELGFRYRGNVSHPGALPGDLLQQGIVSPTARPTQQVDTAFTIALDAQGFRTSGVDGRPDLVAVGDSFTMGPTERQPWPAVLAELGIRAVNLGVNGYGPQQELLTLERFGVDRRPRVVVLAFCEANDMHDATTYESFLRSGLSWPAHEADRIGFRYRPGMFLGALARAWSAPPKPSAGSPPALSPTDPRAAPPLEVTLGGAEMAFGFFVWHWRDLSRSREYWLEQRSWGSVRESILGAKEACDRANSEFVLLFLPCKLHVLFDWVKAAIDPGTLRNQLEAFGDVRSRRDVETLLEEIASNQHVVRDLLADLCRERAIAFLDATPALQRGMQAGRQTSYSYDSHPNPEGHRVIAETVAGFLRVNGLLPR